MAFIEGTGSGVALPDVQRQVVAMIFACRRFDRLKQFSADAKVLEAFVNAEVIKLERAMRKKHMVLLHFLLGAQRIAHHALSFDFCNERHLSPVGQQRA